MATSSSLRLAFQAALETKVTGGATISRQLAAAFAQGTNKGAYFRHTGTGALYISASAGVLTKGTASGSLSAVTKTEEGAAFTFTKIQGILFIVEQDDPTGSAVAGACTVEMDAFWGADSASRDYEAGSFHIDASAEGIAVGTWDDNPVSFDHTGTTNMVTHIFIFGE